MKSTPAVSVVMPVYNNAKFVSEAIESVLIQSMGDFEFIIIDDGSTDGTNAILSRYKDRRVKLISSRFNRGLVASLNRAFELSSGCYIARMDADDVSLPKRLEKQMAFMDAHTDIGACGTWVELIGLRSGSIWRYPTGAEEIRCRLLFENVLAHPSVMMRRSAFQKHHLRYQQDYPIAQDFQLWQRASGCFALANIGEVLVYYRIHPASVSQSKQAARAAIVRRIDREALRSLGINASDAELTLHRALATRRYDPSEQFLTESERWLRRLKNANKQARQYPAAAFTKLLSEKWFDLCLRARDRGTPVSRIFFFSPLSHRPDVLVRVAHRALYRKMGGSL